MLKEKAIHLNELDRHTKALIRLKLREMLHLHPVFRNVSVRETQAKNRTSVISSTEAAPQEGFTTSMYNANGSGIKTYAKL